MVDIHIPSQVHDIVQGDSEDEFEIIDEVKTTDKYEANDDKDDLRNSLFFDLSEDSVYPLMTQDQALQREYVAKIHLANKKFRKTKNVLKSLKIQDDYMTSFKQQ